PHLLGRHLRHYAKNKIVRKQLVGNQDPIEQIPKKLENQAIALRMQLTRTANSAAVFQRPCPASHSVVFRG
ncbi:MAG: hypothetical protein KAT62_13980, partial [Desulfuromonadales bacterium]|nr:hypothetical protein [Desulfuromonadales bacterium]